MLIPVGMIATVPRGTDIGQQGSDSALNDAITTGEGRVDFIDPPRTSNVPSCGYIPSMASLAIVYNQWISCG
jgi:hypothetical protein